MKSLEIRVNDTITVFDTLVEAMHFLTEEIRKWFESDEKTPFNVYLDKHETRGPPSLRISVSDGIGTKSGLA